MSVSYNHKKSKTKPWQTRFSGPIKELHLGTFATREEAVAEVESWYEARGGRKKGHAGGPRTSKYWPFEQLCLF
jgi:hypothetical protein